MTKKIISGLFIFLSVTHLMAQEWKDDKGVKWKLKLDECVFGMGFIYQNELLYQVGPKINIIRKHENFSIIPSIQIQKHNVTYLSPTIIIRFYKPVKNGLDRRLVLSITIEQFKI